MWTGKIKRKRYHGRTPHHPRELREETLRPVVILLSERIFIEVYPEILNSVSTFQAGKAREISRCPPGGSACILPTR